jgi:hypothetical protein
MSNFSILIASPPDREKLVAEIWFGDEQWGVINQESGTLALEIYPRGNGAPWIFRPEEVMKILQQAAAHLVDPA